MLERELRNIRRGGELKYLATLNIGHVPRLSAIFGDVIKSTTVATSIRIKASLALFGAVTSTDFGDC